MNTRIPTQRATSRSSPAKTAHDRSNFERETAQALDGRLDNGYIDSRGQFRKGRQDNWKTRHRFGEANRPEYIRHGLDHVTDQFRIESPCGPGQVWMDTTQPADRTGAYFISDTEGCEVVIEWLATREQGR